jgi:hypothetical protein
MEVFWRQLLAPFLMVMLLFVARYVSRLFLPLIPDGRIKRFLTKPRSNRSEFFERCDARMFAFFRFLLRKARGQ